MAQGDNIILELTADRGSGDELVRFSVFPVAQSTDVHPRLVGVPTYELQAGLWIWETTTSSGIGQAEVISADGVFDWLHTADVRDKPARLLAGPSTAPFGSYAVVAEPVVDFIGTGQNGRLIVVFAASDIKLQGTWQTDFYTDTTPNARIRGLPVPVTLGHCWQVPAVLETPNDLEYAVHTEAPYEVIEVQSNGNPATGAQWDPLGRGFEMLITPAGRITAEVKGSSISVSSGFGTDIVGSAGQFTGSNGINPPGWTTVDSGLNTIELQSNQLDNVTGTTTPATITRNIGMSAGTLHRLNVDLFNGSFGTRSEIKIVDTDGASEHIIYDWAVPSGSSLQVDFTPTYAQIRVLFRRQSGFNSIRIDNLTVRPQTVMQTFIGDLDGLIPYVAEQAGWDVADIDTTGLAALDTAVGSHELGMWLDATTTGNDIIRQLLGQFLATKYIDEAGVMRFARLVDPGDIGGSPVLEITPEQIPAGETVTVEDDLMPGLTDTFGGRRNWLPIPTESSAGAIASDMQKREDVAAEHRFVVTGANSLHPFYAWAEKRCIFPTTVVDETSLQALADHVTDIASVRRQFIRVPMLTSDLPDLRPFQKVNVTWPGKGLQSGVDTALVGVTRRLIGPRVDLLLWR